MEIGAEIRPELADIGRLTRRLLTRTIMAARAEEGSAGRLLSGHLGANLTALPVARAIWPGYDRVNVQTGVNVWLAEPGRTCKLVGLTRVALTQVLLGGAPAATTATTTPVMAHSWGLGRHG